MPAEPKTENQLVIRPVLFFLAILATCGLCSLFLETSPGPVFQHIERISSWFQGGSKPDPVTWPAWGLSLLIALVPSHTVILVIQCLIAALALTFLFLRLGQEFPKHQILLAGLLLTAIPWHMLHVSLYPHALAGSLALLATLTLDRAMARGDARLSVMAGSLSGLAQNFRTEFVLLPLFILAVFGVFCTTGLLPKTNWKCLSIFFVTALLLQAPWAVFYKNETGRFSLTESNAGHVLYCSLGSRRDNPWGILGDDQAAQDEVDRMGIPASSLSDEGGRALLSVTIARILENPAAFGARTVQQAKNTLMAPFGWGQPKLTGDEKAQLDALREEGKALVGVGVNSRQLQQYRSEARAKDALGRPKIVAAFMYQVLATAVGTAICLVGSAGIIIMIYRRKTTVLLLLLASAAVYKLTQNTLLAYQVNYLNNVYPAFVPFAVITMAAIRDAVVPPSRSKILKKVDS